MCAFNVLSRYGVVVVISKTHVPSSLFYTLLSTAVVLYFGLGSLDLFNLFLLSVDETYTPCLRHLLFLCVIGRSGKQSGVFRRNSLASFGGTSTGGGDERGKVKKLAPPDLRSVVSKLPLPCHYVSSHCRLIMNNGSSYCSEMENSCRLTLRLLDMLERTGYELVQENGQRRLTAPEIVRGDNERKKGAEVFLGRLPRDCYEDELMPFLQRIGRLVELRLMLDFSGSTRGYAFALFQDSKTAKRACLELDGSEIRPGHRVGVVKSVDNCRLFFGGVPKNKTKGEFMEELSKILDGIVDIYIYPSAHDKSLNRGFIFVEFKDHRAAAMARRKLIPGRVILWDHEIAVDWADPEPGDPVDDEIMQSVTTLFVRNLSLNAPQQKVKEMFQRATGIPILKFKKINHFAFIHYENRQAAEAVMDFMTKPRGIAEMEGWEIRWAKPIGASKVVERQRTIYEAIAKSKTTKSHFRVKHLEVYKKTVNAIAEANEEDFVNKSAAVHALQNLIQKKLNAVCTVECICLPYVGGFVCKISIHRYRKTIYEFHGDVMLSKHKAISVAAIKLSQYLNSNMVRSEPLPAPVQQWPQPQANLQPELGPSFLCQKEIPYTYPMI